MALHLASLWNRGLGQLQNGLLHFESTWIKLSSSVGSNFELMKRQTNHTSSSSEQKDKTFWLIQTHSDKLNWT